LNGLKLLADARAGFADARWIHSPTIATRRCSIAETRLPSFDDSRVSIVWNARNRPEHSRNLDAISGCTRACLQSNPCAQCYRLKEAIQGRTKRTDSSRNLRPAIPAAGKFREEAARPSGGLGTPFYRNSDRSRRKEMK